VIVDFWVLVGINMVVFFAGFAFGHRRRHRHIIVVGIPEDWVESAERSESDG